MRVAVCADFAVALRAEFKRQHTLADCGLDAICPGRAGMDSARLDQASKFIESSSPTRLGLLVVKNGRLVYERYFHGTQPGDANDICSISKSIISVLTGIALDEGILSSPSQKLNEFYPEYLGAGDNPHKSDITLANLLSMSAGFQWDDLHVDLPRCTATKDWHRCVIASALVDTPGSKFNYNSCLTHLVSGILTKRSGMSTLAFATSRLFRPLGIQCARWDQDPHGYFIGGWQVYLTPRDLAKFGLLFLRNGQWDGRQIVSAQWLRDSSRLRIRTGDAGWGFGDYGWFWWKKTLDGYPVTLASGYGGQNIFLIPDLDLMMVTTAEWNIDAPIDYYMQAYKILTDFVLPAVLQGAPQVVAASVGSAADPAVPLAQGAFGTLQGANLALVDKTWDADMPADGLLPDCIGGVCVKLDGRTASVSHVSEGQVEFLIPPDLEAGSHTLQVVTPQGNVTQQVQVEVYAPALYTTLQDGNRLATTQPVRAGETTTLLASGLGASTPATQAGAVVDGALPLAILPDVSVGGHTATVLSAALVRAGVWQINIQVPAGVAPGAAIVQVRAGGVWSPSNTTLLIVR